MSDEATMDDFMDLMNSLRSQKTNNREWIFVTGTRGMYNFNFQMGGVGSPRSYIMHYSGGNRIVKYIYITLGHKFSNIKCKVRMWNDVAKIEVMDGTTTLFHSNHFDSVYAELEKRGIKILRYDKYSRRYKYE